MNGRRAADGLRACRGGLGNPQGKVEGIEMADEKKTVKETVAHEFSQLAAARDELRVQMRLARADARDEWERLERTWEQIETEFKHFGDHARAPAKEISAAARTLMTELKRSYERVKAEIKL